MHTKYPRAHSDAFLVECILSKDAKLEKFYNITTIREFRTALGRALDLAYQQGYDDTKAGKLL